MERIKIMLNGIPGNVASNIAKLALSDERLTLLPYSLTGAEITEESIQIGDKTIELIKPDAREKRIGEIASAEGFFITVDYTHPTAVNDNGKFYCNNNLPFVMGTTGGDRELLLETVEKSSNCAVIAPNMAKQIVGLQAIFEYGAKTFPGLFKGYSMDVKESHQKGKADTSGTAKAMVEYFNSLGIDFPESRIRMERDPEIQENEWGIPEEHIPGHAWHTYTLDSPDKNARFAVTHNINGRDIYAEGTFDAVVFLKGKKDRGEKGKVYSMIDILKGA